MGAMKRDGGEPEVEAPAREVFQTTIWSEVLCAGDAEDSRAAEALEKLCGGYWFPIYAYIRRRGHDSHEAQDLTQGFFTRLLERNYLQLADNAKGRFRSFLITAVKWHLANEWDRLNAGKRGGGSVTFSLDEDVAEERFRHEPSVADDTERAYDRQWARAILERALARLRREFEENGETQRFERLSALLLGGSDSQPYAEVAKQLDMSEGGVKSAVRRLRLRCGELFREEISGTVAAVDEVDDEVRYLLSLLGE